MSSIFGNTYGGVSSPLVFHEHPYPTRYHGMSLTVPRFDMPYRENPYAVAPYAGVGAVSPDGIGSVAAGAVVAGGLGGALMGVVPGAVIGAFVAKDPAQGVGYGALAGMALGALLFGGLIAATAKPIERAAASGLGSSCGCSGVSRAGGTKSDLSALGGGVFR